MDDPQYYTQQEQTSALTPPDGRAEITAAMTRLQRALLAEGFRYLEGNADEWPYTPILMVKDDAYLLLSPWPVNIRYLGEVWEKLRRQVGIAGLLLVGTDDPDAVMNLLQPVGGPIAYVDAHSAGMRVRRGPGAPQIWMADRLTAFLSASESVQPVDPREVLRTQLESRAQIATVAGDDRPPIVTYGIIGICALVFLITLLKAPGLTHQELIDRGALYPPLVMQGEWWRLLTAGFLHGNIVHLGFNMFALYNLGMVLERWQGAARMAALFLFSVLAASLMVLWWNPDTVTLGASGGVFGLLGGFIVIALRYWKDFPKDLRKQLFGWIPQVLLINGAISFLPGISLAGHVGGLLGGMLIGLFILRSPMRKA